MTFLKMCMPVTILELHTYMLEPTRDHSAEGCIPNLQKLVPFPRSPFDMSVFEPETVVALLQSLEPSAERKKFAQKWRSNVDARIKSWTSNRKTSNQSVVPKQLDFEANIVVYVNYLSASLQTRKPNAPPPRL
ncbi:hypothetical protein F5878DRAFT_307483 [Lentinula raphanica]|uniref:Uncharacterized protein n=1 Tax=Lentinula raphanica TaxID=153919 RepID=A0AA38P372_9AGAR|nr:hypothetical protein F5878DRAFT_307483 [Lentinula raphanica]